MSSPVCYDVAVIGGGPAGSATALELARSGHTVALLERSCYQEPRVGEMLPPAVQPLLARLGVWERFRLEGHASSPGIVAVWGSEQPHEQDFIFSPYGHGWHVERARFDALLAASAAAAGAVVYRGARVRRCSGGGSAGWRVDAVQEDRRVRLRTGFLVDATGRARSAAPSPTRRLVYDRLIGCVTLLASPPGEPDPDPRTLVEAVQDGWWYSAPLGKDRIVFAYMSDADLVARGRKQRPAFWTDCLEQAPRTRERIRRCLLGTEWRIVAANSVRRQEVVGAGWLAAGDAACSFDPLSAQGVLKALSQGEMAAHAVGEALRGRTAGLTEYALAIERGYEQYLHARTLYYAAERRWPGSPFWRRRLVDG